MALLSVVGNRMKWTRNRVVGVGLILIFLLGMQFRWSCLTDRSIWFDEAFSWRMVQYPLGEMIERISLDNSPPLYFVLLKYWSATFGDSLLALRSLSALLGGTTIIAMFMFVRAATAWSAPNGVSDEGQDGWQWEAALAAAFLVAISPFQVRWSWDIRPYALGTALSLFSSWALFRALPSSGGRTRWWHVYTVVTVLFMYTHYFALFQVLAQALFVSYVLLHPSEAIRLRHSSAPQTRAAVVAFVLIGVCWLPWIPAFLRQMSQVRADFWIQPFHRWDLAHVLYQMFVEPENPRLTETASLWTIDLCVLGWLMLLWRPRRETLYVAGCAILPIGSAIALDWFGVHVFLLRYLLFAHLYFLAGLALLIVYKIPFPFERRVVMAAVALSGLIVWSSFVAKADLRGHPGSRAAAEWLAEYAGPDEPVVMSSPFCYLPMLYHLRTRGNCYLYQGEALAPHYLGTAVLGPQDLLSGRVLRECSAPHVWVVESTARVAGANEVPLPSGRQKRTEGTFPEVFGLGQIQVYRYAELNPTHAPTTRVRPASQRESLIHP